MRKYQGLTIVAVLALALLGLALLPVATQPATAAPPAAPTAVSNLVVSTQRNLFQPMTARGITADYNTEAMDVSSFSYADVQWAAVQGTTVNTTALYIQYSNDKANWVTGETLTSSMVTSDTDMVRVPLYGNYARVKVDVEGSGRITWTISALAR